MKELIERLREGKKANAPYETDYAIPPTKLNREAADALELQDKEIEAQAAEIEALRQDGSRLTAENAALRAEHLARFEALAAYTVLLESERDTLRADADRYQKGLNAVQALIDESSGVGGLHLNGDFAEWEELQTGGRFEGWLADFDAAIAGEKHD